jgi:hypothetical protein
MSVVVTAGVVVFVNDVERMAAFYATAVPMHRVAGDAQHVVLRARAFELVVHALPADVVAAWPVAPPAVRREDSYLKPVFQVPDLDAARARVIAAGGQLAAVADEWTARGLRFAEGADPEGNVLQFRAVDAKQADT